MKTKLTTESPQPNPAPAILLALVMALSPNPTLAAALPGAATPSGATPAPVVRHSPPTGIPAIDPATGLPAPEQWIASDWKDPDKTLPSVSYESLPLEEVARNLRDQFMDAFDVLIPNAWQDPGDTSRAIDPRSIAIHLQLKNVKAGEIFNAMNLVFETENTPVRWNLTMNGNRPTVLLRILPALVPFSQPVPQPPPVRQERMICFVGDLLGDGKAGGQTMEQLVKTVSEVYQMSYGEPKGVLQFHKEAQLLIINGTVDQISFVQQTLSALKQKAILDRRPRSEGKPEPAPDKPKAGEAKTF